MAGNHRDIQSLPIKPNPHSWFAFSARLATEHESIGKQEWNQWIRIQTSYQMRKNIWWSSIDNTFIIIRKVAPGIEFPVQHACSYLWELREGNSCLRMVWYDVVWYGMVHLNFTIQWYHWCNLRESGTVLGKETYSTMAGSQKEKKEDNFVWRSYRSHSCKKGVT